MGVSAGLSRSNWFHGAVVVLMLTLSVGVVVTTPTQVWAQENEEKKEDAAKTGHGAGEETNLFIFMLQSVGWFFGIVLGSVSLILVGLIAYLAMDLRMSVSIPPSFVDEFTDTVNKRQFKQAFDLCRNDSSFLGRVLTAGMSRLQYGIEDAREAARNMVENVRASKEQLIHYVATIGTLGPMLGLVGTVFGMILAFKRLSAGGTPRPELLALDISHALVVTLVGVALSVPAIFCNTFYRNRLTRITHETDTLADDLLTQMYHNSKKAGAPAPTTTTGATSRSGAPA